MSKKKKANNNKASHYVPVKKNNRSPVSENRSSVPEKKPQKTEEKVLTQEQLERQERKRQKRKSLLSQIMPYLLAVFTVFVAVCLLKPEVMGLAGTIIHDLFFGLFGYAALSIPVFFLGHVFMWRKDSEEERLLWKVAASLSSVLLIATLLHVYSTSGEALAELSRSFNVVEHWKNGVGSESVGSVGGGALGGFFGALFLTVFGKVGMLILTIAGLVLFVMLFFGLTPKTIWLWVRYKIQMSKERKAEEKASIYQNEPEEKVYEYRKEKKPRQPEQLHLEETQVVNRRSDFDPDVPVDENEETESEPLIIPALEEKLAKEEAARAERAERAEAARAEAAKAEAVKEEPKKTEADLLHETFGNSTEKAIDDEVYAQFLKKNTRRNETSGVVPREMIVAERAESLQTNPDLGKLDSDEFDDGQEKLVSSNVSDLFANPEDKLLIDRLAEQYLRGDNNEISTENEKNPTAPEKPEEEAVPPKPKRLDNYKFPPFDLLYEDLSSKDENIKDELYDNASKLVETLRSFNVKTKIVDVSRGPTITRYELLPEAGTRVRSIANLVDDISLNLATGGIRIEAPIPGKAAVGIEVPNRNKTVVHLRTLLEDPKFRDHKSAVYTVLGEDVAGAYVYCDIAKMPHLLIAGATGMGKSVCINSMIVSMLYKSSPDDVRMMLIDPKKVEFGVYNGLPHLLTPVVSDPKKASGALAWAVNEMERRFGLIEQVGVRDLKHFNEATKDDPDYEYLPQIVIVIDELADLMMTAPKEVENNICRLAQKARAAGMHLIIGTQRPSVDVITGLIKANIPSRIACTVASQIDSRTIIDRAGAESLIGQGDMLYNPVGAQKPLRVQGAYVSESDVEKVVDYIKRTSGVAEYDQQVGRQIEEEAARCGEGAKKAMGDEDEGGETQEDPMLRKAVELAVESGKISTSLIQRRLSLGYGRAAKLIDRMQELGYVSSPDGQKPREVLITKEQFMEMVVHGDEM